MTTGIVHIGVGAFHRAHQAVFADRLLAADPASPWAICGVGMLASDAAVRDGLRAQGFTYNLVLKHPAGALERHVVSSLTDMLLAPDDPWAVVDRLAHPDTRVVTLTITEGGYGVDDVTGEFDGTAAGVVADAVPGAAPSTVFGVVVHALRRRRDAGLAPFTVVSCDNVEGNGEVARTAFVGFARMLDAGLADWVDTSVAFPSSMVDRITPVTTPADRALLQQRWGVVDAVPVVAEPFLQWVLEDRFTDGRPPWEDAGVQMVADVRPYELMKLRLLNAGHQVIAYYGQLLGHELVHEAATDPDVVALLRRYLEQEATPTLEPLPGFDLAGYRHTLLERLTNPEVRDTLARLAAYASDRIPKFLVPVIRENAAAGRPVALSCGVVASWLRWTEVNGPHVVDRRWGGRTPEQLLQDRELFGDLATSPAFRQQVGAALGALRTSDPRTALRLLLEQV